MTEQEWRNQWDASRMFFTADGESGKPGGNETIRVDADGQLRIKTPAALANQFGSHVVIDAPVHFGYRGDEWVARVKARRAVRYDISYDPDRGRWYLDASWTIDIEPTPDLAALRAGPVLGVDLNAGHLACCVLDAAGNPVGAPVSIEVCTDGLAASRRDGRLRGAITALLDHAARHSCTAIVIEKLDFADARATGRETLGRGNQGKGLRRTISGIPTRRFRDRLVAMAARRGVAVIGVDAAYTSKWGNQHWTKPLQQQTVDSATVTSHHGAAAAIGRRGLGLAIRRRPVADSGPLRAHHRPGPIITAVTVAGTAVPAHRPTHQEVRRSTGKHPPPAANTVRAAQDPLLLSSRNGFPPGCSRENAVSRGACGP
jgi:IS605 OrfB family transposase